MNKIYYSILKTVEIKNFVPKQKITLKQFECMVSPAHT
jgi:hypothetical protein